MKNALALCNCSLFMPSAESLNREDVQSGHFGHEKG